MTDIPDWLETVLTTSQAAEHCRVDPKTIRTWVHRNRLHPIRDIDGNPVKHPETGENVFKLLDVAKAEHATRRRARRAA